MLCSWVRRLTVPALGLGLLLATCQARADDAIVGFAVEPDAVSLGGNFAQGQLLVSTVDSDGTPAKHSADLTHKAAYASSDPQVVTVNESGRLLARGNGSASVKVTLGNVSHEVPVTVSGVQEQPQLQYLEHVLPILSKAGCNAGACHASQYGKGGFKLSVFGFAPDQDYRTDRARPRRAADRSPATRAEPAAAQADAGRPARRQPAARGRLDRPSDARRLARGRRARPGQQGAEGDGIRVLPRERVGAARLHAAVAGRGHLQRRPPARRHRLGPLRQHGRRRGEGHARRAATRPSAAARRR